MSWTGCANVIVARSLLGALAALVTDDAEVLLKVTAQRSAINSRKLFMIIVLSKVLCDVGNQTWLSQNVQCICREESLKVAQIWAKVGFREAIQCEKFLR